MPSLAQTLPTNDLGFLRIVASLWGIELTSSDPAEAAIELAEGLCDAELLEEIVSTLPKEARSALMVLAEQNGRMPWVAFARRFGELREMGPGKRDREQPHHLPASVTEVLWYRGLVSRAFLNPDKISQDKPVEKGPQEFAFIPEDLYMAMDFAGIIHETVLDNEPDFTGNQETQEIDIIAEKKVGGMGSSSENDVLGRPASPAEKAVVIIANDHILDDVCSFLAAYRMGLEPPSGGVPLAFLQKLLVAAGLISPSSVNPEAVKSQLEASRGKALEFLRNAWQSSGEINELRLLPGLVFEGGWSNQPLVTREFIMNLLEPLPDNQWWSLPAFVRDVKAKYPDFQRPAGDYDSWFIKREADGVFLRGFSNWEEVDGALIRYLISGPLHWLGLVDLAAPVEDAVVTSFRAHIETNRLGGQANIHSETGKLTVSSQGKIVVPRLVPRATRYQIARFCEWDEPKNHEYHYRATARSLRRAKEQKLKVDQLIAVLRKHSSAPLPPSFVKALQRWEQNGSEARVESLVVLKVSRPEVLNELRASKAGRFLGEIIGPTTVAIQAGSQAKVIASLAELGIIAELQESQDNL